MTEKPQLLEKIDNNAFHFEIRVDKEYFYISLYSFVEKKYYLYTLPRYKNVKAWEKEKNILKKIKELKRSQ